MPLFRKEPHEKEDHVSLEDAEDRTSNLLDSGPRLSRLSCNTRYAVSLNQIDQIEINNTRVREKDGVTLYVLDIYMRYVQTGIPTKRNLNYHDTENELVKQREKDKNPHYQIEYRFRDFYELRRQIKHILHTPEDPLHNKWCRYCTRVSWIVEFGTFSSRCLLDQPLMKIELYRKTRVKARCLHLTEFLNDLVQGAKDAPYCSGETPCDGFSRVSYVLKEFLAEPSLRESCTGW
ncbi:hypothetical protein Poli38472_002626 [Pythium oligandrum]|uniref:PX domain-containing protein n=1 Tax=Pythium oligandrum TaxID=41045 RepID=A0A8K1CI66_PYTOL|nr:hypothetical protein Poli38472_002626 [Pythium oligandrum]|eukprot:TMW63685.1 hypothetical protein Poli38472_002626 [Pythium oligandrum]